MESDDVRRLMLLNTDWTASANRKMVVIDSGSVRYETEVVERVPMILTLLPDMILEPDDPAVHLEVVRENGRYRIFCNGTGQHEITVHQPDGVSRKLSVDLTQTTRTEVQL